MKLMSEEYLYRMITVRTDKHDTSDDDLLSVQLVYTWYEFLHQIPGKRSGDEYRI